MAKKSSKRTNFRSTRQISTTDHSTRDYYDRSPRRRLSNFPTLSEIREVEDLRSVPHDVKVTQGYRVLSGRPAGVVYLPRQRSMQPSGLLRDLFPSMHARFQDTWRTIVCIRRRARRHVLFALRKMGKGGGRHKRPVWTDKSYISCK